MFANLKFSADILHSRLITHQPTNLCDLIETYNTTLSSLIDKHAPLKTKFIRAKPIYKWFAPALSTLKLARRHLEKIWLNSRSPDHLKLLRATNKYHFSIIVAQKIYNASLICASTSSPRKLWNSIKIGRASCRERVCMLV